MIGSSGAGTGSKRPIPASAAVARRAVGRVGSLGVLAGVLILMALVLVLMFQYLQTTDSPAGHKHAVLSRPKGVGTGTGMHREFSSDGKNIDNSAALRGSLISNRGHNHNISDRLIGGQYELPTEKRHVVEEQSDSTAYTGLIGFVKTNETVSLDASPNEPNEHVDAHDHHSSAPLAPEGDHQVVITANETINRQHPVERHFESPESFRLAIGPSAVPIQAPHSEHLFMANIPTVFVDANIHLPITVPTTVPSSKPTEAPINLPYYSSITVFDAEIETSANSGDNRAKFFQLREHYAAYVEMVISRDIAVSTDTEASVASADPLSGHDYSSYLAKALHRSSHVTASSTQSSSAAKKDGLGEYHFALRSGHLCQEVSNQEITNLVSGLKELADMYEFYVVFDISSMSVYDSMAYSLAPENPSLTHVLVNVDIHDSFLQSGTMNRGNDNSLLRAMAVGGGMSKLPDDRDAIFNNENTADDDGDINGGLLGRSTVAKQLQTNHSLTELSYSHCSAEMFYPSNLYVVHSSMQSFNARNKKAYNCLQNLQNLDAVVSGQSYLEFQASLGSTICRCNVTVLPRALPNNHFFSFWESLDGLLSAAADSGGCALNTFPKEFTPSKLSRNYAVYLRNDSIVEISNAVPTISVQDLLDASLDTSSYFNVMSAVVEYSSIETISDEFSRATAEVDSDTLPVTLVGLDAAFTELGLFGSLASNVEVDGDGQELLSKWLSSFQDVFGVVAAAAAVVRSTPGGVHLLPLEKHDTGTSVVQSSATAVTNTSSPVEPPILGLPTEQPIAVPTRTAVLAPTSASIVNSTADESSNHTQTTIKVTNAPTAAANSSTVTLAPAGTNSVHHLRRHRERIRRRLRDADTIWDLPVDTDRPELSEDSLGEWDTVKAKESDKTGSSSKSSKLVFDDVVRNSVKFFERRESTAYTRWMRVLMSDSIGKKALKKAQLVYLFGRHVSMLSSRIAEALQSQFHRKLSSTSGTKGSGSLGLVVSVLSDTLALNYQSTLATSKELTNLLICRNQLHPTKIAVLIGSPERADVSIVQADIIIRLITGALSSHPKNGYQPHESSIEDVCGSALIEESIAVLLTAAQSTFIEMPSVWQLKQIFSGFLNEDCQQHMFNRYSNTTALIRLSLERIREEGKVVVTDIETDLLQSTAIFHHEQPFNKENGELSSSDKYYETLTRSTVLRVTIQLFGSAASQPSNSISAGGASSAEGVIHHAVVKPWVARSSCHGISVYTLLHLGLLSEHKKRILQLYVDLPLWYLDTSDTLQDDHVPWKLFVSLRGKAMEMNLRYFGGNTANQCQQQLQSNNNDLGVMTGKGSAFTEMKRSKIVWKAVLDEMQHHQAELCDGRFSFVEHNSGYGYFSARLARQFPNATVISLESSITKTDYHVGMLENLQVANNVVCAKSEGDDDVFKKLYDSPEYFRFQLISRGLETTFATSNDLKDWGSRIGKLLSTALTTFVALPLANQVSLGMQVLFGGVANSGFYRSSSGPYRPLSSIFVDDKSAVPRESSLLPRSKELTSGYSLSSHPRKEYEDLEERWLLKHARVDNGGDTQVTITPLNWHASSRLPLVRVDVVNMTRYVHHHYDYKKDGHTRTYTMHVEVNETITRSLASKFYNGDFSAGLESSQFSSVQFADGVGIYKKEPSQPVFMRPPEDGESSASSQRPAEDTVQAPGSATIYKLPPGYHLNGPFVTRVGIFRDKDNFFIPYTSIYGVTLITILRLGLVEKQRDRYFHKFLKLPLYEDMTSWNIVMMGPNVDYIDYDTKDFTFDSYVPKAYMVMSILMNYKRTVEDFKKCGSKASTVYGISYISDCIGDSSPSKMSCPDLNMPVPCGDGNCQSDYIACLQSLSKMAEDMANEYKNGLTISNGNGDRELATTISDAIKKHSWKFDDKKAALQELLS